MSDERVHFSPEAISWALAEEFPASAIKSRSDGRQSFDYIEGHTVIHRLIKATGNDYSFRITGVQVIGDEAVIVFGELTIPGLGTRGDIGTSALNRTGQGRLMDDSIKGAATDCLKRCARQFGVALYLYGEDYEADNIAPVERYERPEQRSESVRTQSTGPGHSAAPTRSERVESSGTNDQPMTEAQQKAIYGIGKGELGIDVESDQFNDLTVLHWGVPWRELSKRQASELIDRMKKDPASLDATTLPKDARLAGVAADYWIGRITAARSETEARDIHDALKRRYRVIDQSAAVDLMDALGRWGIKGSPSAD